MGSTQTRPVQENLGLESVNAHDAREENDGSSRNGKDTTPDQTMEDPFPIHTAACLGDVQKLEILRDSNCLDLLNDSAGCTPLHNAAMRGN